MKYMDFYRWLNFLLTTDKSSKSRDSQVKPIRESVYIDKGYSVHSAYIIRYFW